MRPIPANGVDIDDVTRRGLEMWCDALLPGTATMPSGRGVGTHLDLIDAVLAADPDLVEAVVTLARSAAERGSVDLSDQVDETYCEKMIFAINAAYYMSAEVTKKLGYPGPTRRPINLASPDELGTPEMLAPVIARGEFYVATPGSQR